MEREGRKREKQKGLAIIFDFGLSSRVQQVSSISPSLVVLADSKGSLPGYRAPCLKRFRNDSPLRNDQRGKGGRSRKTADKNEGKTDPSGIVCSNNAAGNGGAEFSALRRPAVHIIVARVDFAYRSRAR